MPPVRRILVQWEEETALLSENPPALVPFLMEDREENGEPVLSVEAYRGTEDAILPFLRDFGETCFSDGALRTLHAALRPYFAKIGYRIDEYGVLRYYFATRLDAGTALPSPPSPPGVSVRLIRQEDAAAVCRLTLSPPLLYERWRRRPDLPCAVAVDETSGEILSAATVADAAEDSHVREITVETAVFARGRGLGKAVTARLALELLSRGFSCAYCYSRWNRPSKKIARSLGFRCLGRFYAVSGYKE